VDFLSRLEKKYGRLAVPGLMRYFTALYAAGFVLYFLKPGFYTAYLALDPGQILKGQVWRLLTFLVYPPSDSLFWGLIVLLMYYQLGMALESAWGSFRFTVYMFTGVLFHILAAFILYFVFGFRGSQYYAGLTPQQLNLSIFLAFAATYPDMRFYIYFVLPVKAKYMAILYAVVEIYFFAVGSMVDKVSIFLCLFNFILFFFLSGSFRRFSPRELRRKRQFRDSVRRSAPVNQGPYAQRGSPVVPVGQGTPEKIRPESRSAGTRHKCAVCGRTELDGDNLVFRYCSKCYGDYEYCQDHLYTHVHVLPPQNPGMNGQNLTGQSRNGQGTASS
jgi:hypothetical protein